MTYVANTVIFYNCAYIGKVYIDHTFFFYDINYTFYAFFQDFITLCKRFFKCSSFWRNFQYLIIRYYYYGIKVLLKAQLSISIRSLFNS